MPIGIIATLVVCTVLYIGVAVVLTGLVPWKAHDGRRGAGRQRAQEGLSVQPGGHRLHWIRLFVVLGALMGMISSILVFQLGQARVWFSMSRDRLLPDVFSHVHPHFRTPAVATWVAGFVVGIPAGLLDIGTVSNLSNIGTLFAFVLVSAGVLILRYREPDRRRGFRVPSDQSSRSSASSSASCSWPGCDDHLDPLLRLARHRSGDLFLLQPASQRVLVAPLTAMNVELQP